MSGQGISRRSFLPGIGRRVVSTRRAAWLGAGVLLAIGLVGLAEFGVGRDLARFLPGQAGQTPARPVETLARETRALGRLEPVGEVVDIGATVGDRLVRLMVKEGDLVRKDQALAFLDSYALRKLEVEAAEKQLAEAKAKLAAELKLAEARVVVARLGLQQAQTRSLDIETEEIKIPVLEQNWQLARNDRERFAGLSKRLVSDQEREQQDLAVQKAKAELDAARRSLDKAKQSNGLGLQAAQAELDAALANKQVAIDSFPAESLEKRLELARAQWERSVLHAPSDGTVLRILVRPGEIVGATPLLQMADLDRMVVIAQVYEADIKRIRLGHKAIITSQSLRSPYDIRGLEGKVVRIGEMISRPALKDPNPLAPADRRAVDVRIELGEEASRQARDFVHMQVDVAMPVVQP